MLERSWAAGLFEGEGSFARRQRGRRVSLVLLLGGTDEDVVRRFRDAVAVGNVNGPYQPSNQDHKPYWQWSVSGQAALAMAFRPDFTSFLGQRRRARVAEIVVEVMDQPPPLRSPDATHCPNDHPYDEENTAINDSGHRRCRRCSRDRARITYRRDTPMATARQ